MRAGSDETAEILGLPAGLPANPYNNGTIGTDGFLYVRQGPQSDIWRIDISALTATAITLSDAALAGTTSDFAWVGGLLYSVNTAGQLISIHPGTGLVTAIGAPTTPRNYGVVFGAANGLFVNDNAGAGLYQVNLTTGALTLLGVSPGTSSNDGANCAGATLVFNQGVAAVPALNTMGLLMLSGVMGFALWARRRKA